MSQDEWKTLNIDASNPADRIAYVNDKYLWWNNKLWRRETLNWKRDYIATIRTNGNNGTKNAIGSIRELGSKEHGKQEWN